MLYSYRVIALLGAPIGSVPFFYSEESRMEKMRPFQGSVRDDLRKKNRAGKGKNSGAGRILCEGLTLPAFLLLPPKSSTCQEVG